MINWLLELPKTLLAILVILAGIFYMIFTDPPHTVCDTQIEMFLESQKGIITSKGSGKSAKSPRLEKLTDTCENANTAGGCYELFHVLGGMLDGLDQVPSQCVSDVGGIGIVKKTILKTTELMIRLAWGEKPPVGYQAKQGWFDTADIGLFCRLQSAIKEYYGKENWDGFRNRVSKDLPGADKLSSDDVLGRSLLSIQCAYYR